MEEKSFKKQYVDNMKSPDRLDNYIRVTNPGIWLLLACIILIIVGACVWGVFGHIDSSVSVTVQIKDKVAVCYLDEEDIVGVTENMTVKFNGNETTIDKIEKIVSGGYVCTLKEGFSLPDGYYEGYIIIKGFRPISFILN